MLRAALFAGAACCAVGSPAVCWKEVVVKHDRQVGILEHEGIIVQGEVHGDVYTMGTRQAVSTTGAVNLEHASIDLRDLINYGKLFTGERFWPGICCDAKVFLQLIHVAHAA